MLNLKLHIKELILPAMLILQYHISLPVLHFQTFELDGGIFYEMNGGFQKEALERLVDYAYTAHLDVPGEQVSSSITY